VQVGDLVEIMGYHDKTKSFHGLVIALNERGQANVLWAHELYQPDAWWRENIEIKVIA